MPGSSVQGTTEEVLTLLTLPDLDTRTDDQTRGATCVWDDVPLTVETAVDLGERLSPLTGSTSPMRWFPRACPRCAGEAAVRAIRDHAPRCEQCVDDASRCETRAMLEQLARWAR